MQSFEELFKEFLKKIKEGTQRIKRDEVFGLIVSTALTPDCGYETAIMDKKGVHVVERYKTYEECLIGHEKWKEKAKTLTSVIEIGWLGLTEEEEIILERNFDVAFLNKV